MNKFIPSKAQQAILYVAGKLPEQRNMYKVLKVLYFADIDHLFSFGRFIFGDNYVALEHGPVPSHAYAMVQNVRTSHIRLDENDKDEALFAVNNTDTIVPMVQPDLSCFSKSDLMCLDKAIEECRPLSFAQLKKRSHDAAYDQAGENSFISVESIASMAPDKDELLNYLQNRHA